MTSRLSIRRQAPKAMPLINIMGEALGESGQPTVSPSLLQELAGASDKTIKGWLLALAGLGLVKQVTTQKWRLTIAGCWMANQNPELLRLSKEETRNDSEFFNRTIGETRSYSDFSQNEKPGATPTFEVDTVSLRLNPGATPGYFPKPGNSDFSPAVVVSSLKNQYLNQETTTTADRLLAILKDRAPRTNPAKARGKLAQLLTDHCPEQIELDIIGHCARLAADQWRGCRSPAAVVLSLIADGHHAGQEEREHIARGSPGEAEAYVGYLEPAHASHPDLERFDALTSRLEQEQLDK